MKRNLLTLSVMSALLAACSGGGGDVEIAPSTNVQDSNNTTTTSGDTSGDNPCASYTEDGQTFQGSVVDNNCVYGSSFVDVGNELMTDVTFDDLPNDGAHVFQASLFVGANGDSDAELADMGITQGGDGPTITVEAGATLAFQTNSDFMVINRGSQIQAVGTASNPITITSVSDIEGNVGPEDVSQWGGMVINGFGVTNKCSYTGSVDGGDLALDGECHVPSEGSEGDAINNYGGDNNADSSGTLQYFIVKHTGAQVDNGDELNGITFSGVGSGTTVDHLQVYSTFDDGIEMFGGAVNISNFLALYVRDDSIDIDEGYRGTVDTALVIQSETDGNHCVESDGIGSHDDLDEATRQDFIDRGLNSRATLRNLTCIISPNGADTATHDPGAGLRIREAHFPTIENAVITTAYQGDGVAADPEGNYCVRIEDGGEQAALDGEWSFTKSVIACQDLTAGDLEGSSTEDWLRGIGSSNENAVYQTAEAGEDPTTASNPALEILDSYFALPVGDMVVDSAAVTFTPNDGRSYIGGLIDSQDWTQGWTYGLDPNNRGQALWFE